MATGLIQMTPSEYGTITLDENVLHAYGKQYYFRYGNLLVFHLCFNVVSARSSGSACISSLTMPSFTYKAQDNVGFISSNGNIYPLSLSADGLVKAAGTIPVNASFDITWPMIVTS